MWFFFKEKFLKPVELQNESNKEDAEKKDESGPKAADWRFGPAQIWYDMLEVPESGDGFTYGFKMRDEKEVSFLFYFYGFGITFW